MYITKTAIGLITILLIYLLFLPPITHKRHQHIAREQKKQKNLLLKKDCGKTFYVIRQMRVSAYCSCTICCGKWSDGQTASGYWIQSGDRFVAAPKHIPFGTEMVVPGYNDGEPVKVLDRGGAITHERLDVYFDTHQEALNWGVRYLVVEVVEKN